MKPGVLPARRKASAQVALTWSTAASGRRWNVMTKSLPSTRIMRAKSISSSVREVSRCSSGSTTS